MIAQPWVSKQANRIVRHGCPYLDGSGMGSRKQAMLHGKWFLLKVLARVDLSLYGALHDKIGQPGHLKKTYVDIMSTISETYVDDVNDVVKTSLKPKHNGS
jgi:hypothetical protein